MAGGEPSDIPKLTGLSKYFNSYTDKGRANCVILVYSSIAAIYLIYKLKPSKKK